MSLNIGELVGYIKLDHTGVGQGITAAQRDMRAGMDRMQRDAGQQGEKAGKAAGEGVSGGFKGSVANLAKIAVGAFAVERVVAGLRTAKDAASDLNETTSMSSVIFGRNAAAMKEFAQTGPRALGLSTEATLRYSASLGDMLLQLGFAEQATVDLSKSTVQMAADLGSFKNLGTEDVLERINASLRGEYDSLQLLIPNINAARVQTEALAATGKTAAADLTAQEKATATLAIIQKDGARAAGDFARTQDGNANASKTAAAEAQNLAASFGQKLLPAYTAAVIFGRDEVLPFLQDSIDYMSAAAAAADPLTDAVGGLVGTFRDLPEPLQAATLGIIALVALRGRVEAFGDAVGQRVGAGSKAAAGGLDSLRLGLMYASESSDTAAGRINAVTRSLGASAAQGLRGAASGVLGLLGGPWGLAFGGAIAILGTYMKKQADAKARVDSLTASLDQQTGAITEQTRAQLAKQARDDGLIDQARALGVSSQLLVRALADEGDAFDQLVKMQKEATRESAALTGKTGDLADRLDGAAVSTATWNELTNQSTRSATEQSAGLLALIGQIRPVNEEMASLTAAQAEVGTAAGLASTAEAEFGDVVEETGEKQKTANEIMLEAAEAALALYDAKIAAIGGEVSYQESLADTAAAIEENGKTATKNRKELDLTTEAGRANASALLDQAEAAKARAQTDLEGGASLASLRTEMNTASDAFIDNAIKMGLSKDAAKKMADEFGLSKTGVDKLAESVEGLPASKTIRIEAETAAAAARLQRLKELLAGIKDKKFAVVGTITYVDTSTTNGSRTLRGGQTINEADGGVVSYYADGAHVAQRAPAGSVRVWNEPETGGETYIPHALSKRPRSTAILAQTADEFGYTLIPKGGPGAAVAGGSSSTSTTHNHWNIANLSVPNYAGFREATDEEQRVKNIAGGL